jgi:DNA-binding CsgD family transcriptional regulator
VERQIPDMIPVGVSAGGLPALDHKDRAPVVLTPREHEVLLLLKEGMKNSEISERLVISPQTVKHHLGAIYHKLGVKKPYASTHQSGGTWIDQPRLAHQDANEFQTAKLTTVDKRG